MTLKFYKAEEARLLKVLSGIDPSAPDNNYNRVLNNLENLALHVFRTQDVEERLRYAEENDRMDSSDSSDGYVATPNGNILKLTPIIAEEHPVEQPFPEPEPEEEEPKPKRAKAKPEPAPVPVEEETEKPLDFATVKASFTEAARSGVKVSEIINDTGYTKLSDVPSELYGALMRALERKKAGEEG